MLRRAVAGWLLSNGLAACAAAETPIVERGTCVGPAWIAADEIAAPSEGPDFTVSRIKTDSGEVRIYEGCCSQVSDDRKTRFVRTDGQQVYRTFGEYGFSGYLATERNRIDGIDWEHQSHFFGPGLTGDDRDKEFFKRVRFGSHADERCKGTNE